MQHDVRHRVNPETSNSDCKNFWQLLSTLKLPLECPAGSRLFERGGTAKGLYLVEEGSVTLLLACGNKAEQFAAAGPGAVLGLAETVTGETYRLTAEVASPSRIFHVERAPFLKLMRQNPEFSMQIVRLLSEDLHGLYYRFQGTTPSNARNQFIS
jgi:CRP-like cAMP-binding protein